MDYVVAPLRFSAQPVAMIDFFRSLGMRPVAAAESESESGSGSGSESATSAVYAGRSGLVGVRDAASAGGSTLSTALDFVVEDLQAATAELAEQGIRVESWEQPFGRQNRFTSPAGLVIGLVETNTASEDGLPRQSVAASMDVVALCTVADVDREADFLARLGFGDAELWQDYRRLTARPGLGVIGLRPASAGHPSVELGAETSEPFDALAARLQADGYTATIAEDGSGRSIEVIDPDGRLFEIRPTR